MARSELRRLLRAAEKAALEDVLSLVGGPARIEDDAGQLVMGDAAVEGERHPIDVDGVVFGTVVAAERGDVIARLAANLVARAQEKRTLAAETLGRYKELTLLYDMSDELSKMLDLPAVAQHVVAQADQHLHADTATLYLRTPTDGLQATAFTGEPDAAPDALAIRVFETGHADLVEADGQTVMCAPLRHGEHVFGVLHTRREGETSWNAGDLKLVTAMASNAASALRKAQLHQQHVREMALRHEVQRHVSPELPDAVFGDESPAGQSLAVLFCDLRAAGATDAAAPDDADAFVKAVERDLGSSLNVLMRHGATVDLPLGEILLAVFWDRAGLGSAAERAVRSARELFETLDQIGIGIASGTVDEDATEALQAVISEASRLHSLAPGRVLVDERLEDALAEHWNRTPHTAQNPGSAPRCFEVRLR